MDQAEVDILFDFSLWFFNVSVSINICDNEKVNTENVPALLLVYSHILLFVYIFWLYSFLKGTEATGLSEKTNYIMRISYRSH